MRILVAIDGSECASTAVDLVAAIAWPKDSTIHVIEAVPSGSAVFGGPWPPLPPVDTSAFDDDIRRQAEKDLAMAQARLSAPGRSTEGSVASGRAADVIISLAEQTDADLIVLGSRGHGALESMLLGSVSAEVADHAQVPVLVARGAGIGRVVYAWDGSACAEQAALVLVDWGILKTSEIHVISVTDAAVPRWAAVDMAGESTAYSAFAEAAEASRGQHEQLAGEMADRLRAAGLDAKPQHRSGDPAEQILSIAESQDADLIVVGTHGRTGLARLLMGSVARNVLLHARCSVLIVRERPPDGLTAPDSDS